MDIMHLEHVTAGHMSLANNRMFILVLRLQVQLQEFVGYDCLYCAFDLNSTIHKLGL